MALFPHLRPLRRRRPAVPKHPVLPQSAGAPLGARIVRRAGQTGGFPSEIDRMNLEVREYLSLHPSEAAAAG